MLDLGCGRAMTSVFLAREYGVRVWAADLWMSPDHNWRRVARPGVADRVCPIRAEAHALPFAAGFFDAVSLGRRLPVLRHRRAVPRLLWAFLRPAAPIGVVVPGLMQPSATSSRPTSPRRSRTARCSGRTSAGASRRPRCGASSGAAAARVTDVRGDTPAGRLAALARLRAGPRAFGQESSSPRTPRRSSGGGLGFVRLMAQRTEAAGKNLYDPSLGVRVGVDV